MADTERFVILTWSQASGQPDLDMDFGLYESLDDALDDAAALRTRTAAVGRRERHTVHRIDIDEEVVGIALAWGPLDVPEEDEFPTVGAGVP